MRSPRLLTAIAALSLMLTTPLAALADPDDWHGGWHHDGGWHHEHHWEHDGDDGWRAERWREAHWGDRDDRWGWEERHRFWDHDHHCWYEDPDREWDPAVYHWVPDEYGNYILIHIRL